MVKKLTKEERKYFLNIQIEALEDALRLFKKDLAEIEREEISDEEAYGAMVYRGLREKEQKE